MRAGQLRRQILIEKPAGTSDSQGGQTGTETSADWVKVFFGWAKCESLAGIERFEQERLAAVADWRFSFRYVPGVDENCRVSYNGEYSNVRNVTDVEAKHREIIILTQVIGA